MRTPTALAALALGALYVSSLLAAENQPVTEPAAATEGSPDSATGNDAPPTLEVLKQFSVATADGYDIADVRWASKTTVYIAYLRGIAEVELTEGLPRVRPVLPPTAEARDNLGPLYNLAVSDDRMIATDAGMTLLWGDPSENQPGGASQSAVTHGAFHDIDMRGDDVVVYGVADGDTYEKNFGGILWRSSYSKGLQQWDLLYKSKEVAANFGVLGDTFGAGTGALRFQRDGSLVLAPNSLPGVFLFSPSGKLKKTWTPDDLWGQGDEPWAEGRVDSAQLTHFLKNRRVIDDVLALPSGPAILVREPKGPVRWRLGVLGPEVEWYDIPVAGLSDVARLQGDVDEKGRIVLVGTPREVYDEALFPTTQVIVARLP